MSFVTALLFEEPLYLAPLLVVVQFVLVRRWVQRRTVRSRRAVLIGFVVIPLLLVVQAVVETDRERIISLCRELAIAAEDGDLAAIGAHVADGFQTEGIDRDGFLSLTTRALAAVHPEDARLTGFGVAFTDGRRATVRFRAAVRIYHADVMGSRRLSKWELHFERVSGR
ncbi:MAG: hypothetical protein JSV19_03335, partial [Phycisphaerales bacterium]